MESTFRFVRRRTAYIHGSLLPPGFDEVLQQRHLKSESVSGVGQKVKNWSEWEDVPVVDEE